MQIKWLILLLISISFHGFASAGEESQSNLPPACSEDWYVTVDQRVQTDDGQGHGPDIGSLEWRSVVEYKLGISYDQNVPAMESGEWCGYIDKHILRLSKEGPSYSCKTKDLRVIEQLICEDLQLSSLDRRLAEVYKSALAKAVNQHPPILISEQRGWIKGRDDCWKSEDRAYCVKDEYVRRIAELQARYELLPNKATPNHYVCEDNPAHEIILTFHETDPKTLIAEYGDKVSLMFFSPSIGKEVYKGRNEYIHKDGDKISVIWGYNSPEINCFKAN